jgi:hypothetical protein
VLRYPDRPHQAEALLLSYAGQLVVVTSAAGGRSEVYVAPSPLRPASVLAKVADLDLHALRAPGDVAPASLQVTGGAVAPAGTHFALRTGTAAYEWETPDGDIVRALRAGAPRSVRLPAGTGLTYAGDGRRLLTVGAAAPTPLYEVAIVREPAVRPTEVNRLPMLAGTGAILLLGAGVVVLGRQRRRAARTVTTYQSFG